jgi:transposase
VGGIIQESLGAIIPLQTGGFIGIGRGVRLQPLLRSASRFRTAADSGDAPAPCRGEKAFVDYSGNRFRIVDPSTGEIREAEIFVGVLGASNLTYAEATWTQTLPDWTGAHLCMFRFFGGAPKLLVPDNLKSGVNKARLDGPGRIAALNAGSAARARRARDLRARS